MDGTVENLLRTYIPGQTLEVDPCMEWMRGRDGEWHFVSNFLAREMKAFLELWARLCEVF